MSSLLFCPDALARWLPPLSGRAGWHAQRLVRISRSHSSAPRKAGRVGVCAFLVIKSIYTMGFENGKCEFVLTSVKRFKSRQYSERIMRRAAGA